MARRLTRHLLALVALALPAAAVAQADLTPAIRAYNQGQFDRAALHLYNFIASSGQGGDRARAEFYLAQTLEKLKFFESAKYHYGQIVNAGPSHPYYIPAIEGLIQIAEVVDDDVIVPALLNREYNEDFQRLRPEFLHKANYFVGLVAQRAGNLDEAEAFLLTVPEDSSYFARARYLLGVVQIQKGQQAGTPDAMDQASEAALAYFNQVLQLSDPNYVDLRDLRDLALLGMARTYYGLGEYALAVEYYEQVPRFSRFWDEALFENGWARFMNGDYGGALGTLQALHAPQFAGAFQPESWTLKATIYYTACLYDEAKEALDAYAANYSQYVRMMQPVLAADREASYYYGLIAKEEERKKLPRAVYNYLAANRRVAGFNRYVAQLDSELAGIAGHPTFRGTPLRDELIQVVQQQKNLLENVAGSFIKNRLANAIDMVSHFDAQSEIIRFETSKAETERIESGVDVEAHLARQKHYRPRIPAEDWEYWNFQGEYWIDEIGYYQFTLKTGCVQREEE
ncbi:MAG: tetratricopeptide repeat protein [Pseudomonadota bacterium]